ncbi:MAG: hypothetical protein MZU95_07735 [Desulfomicrobium escambiense]|nr:hypothetical protein [Desulfomicrobium escambiense]
MRLADGPTLAFLQLHCNGSPPSGEFMTWAMFVQHALNGLTLGSLYALIAIGYTMVYGILRLINFAHSEIFMLGAYFVLLGHHPALPALARGHRGGHHHHGRHRHPGGPRGLPPPARRAPDLGPHQRHRRLLLPAEPHHRGLRGHPRRGLPAGLAGEPDPHGRRARPAPHPLRPGALLPAHAGPGLDRLQDQARAGHARHLQGHRDQLHHGGAGQPHHLADLRHRLGARGGLAASCGPCATRSCSRSWASIPGFKAFIAAVFGGIGSIPGAVVGGIMLGVIEIMAVAFFPDLAGYRDAFAFILLIVILLIKPTGLMGERLEDKV